MSHNFHKSVFFGLSVRSLGEVLNTVSDLRNEVLNVTNFFSGVRQEVLSVLLNPGGDGLVESVDERLGHNLKPSDIVDELLSVDVVLNGV